MMAVGFNKQIVQFCESAKTARELAVIGKYEEASVYYEGSISLMQKHLNAFTESPIRADKAKILKEIKKEYDSVKSAQHLLNQIKISMDLPKGVKKDVNYDGISIRSENSGWYNTPDPYVFPPNLVSKEKDVVFTNRKKSGSRNSVFKSPVNNRIDKPLKKNASDSSEGSGSRSARERKNKDDDQSEEEEKKFQCHSFDRDLVEMLERDIVQKNPDVHWDDIADLKDAKELLEEAIVLPMWMPEFFKGIRRPWKGVLMVGPPGTGYSGSDITNVCRDASMMCMRRRIHGLKPEEIKKLAKEDLDLPVTAKDFHEAISKCNKSVSQQDLTKFEKWMKEYGSS